MVEQPNHAHVLSLIEQCQDIGKVISFYKNAKRRGVDLVANAAHRRLKSFIPKVKEQGLDAEFWAMFSAHEDLLLVYDRPVELLNRARQVALLHGTLAALEQWIENTSQVWAFECFMTTQREHFTAEYIALKYRDQFDRLILEKAEARIECLQQKIKDKKLKAA